MYLTASGKDSFKVRFGEGKACSWLAQQLKKTIKINKAIKILSINRIRNFQLISLFLSVPFQWMLPCPSKLSQLRVRVAAMAASFLCDMIRVITAASASYMNDFSMFTKRRSSFTHKLSLYYSGEM
jgi:hypothetical protein